LHWNGRGTLWDNLATGTPGRRDAGTPGRRDKLAGMFLFNIVFGILVAFLSIAIIVRIGGGTLLVVSSIGYIPSLGLTAWAFSTESSQS